MELVEALSPAPDEVGAIWSIPLEYCLTAQWKDDYGILSEKGGPDWPYDDEFYVSDCCCPLCFVRLTQVASESFRYQLAKNFTIPDEPISHNAHSAGKRNRIDVAPPADT